MSPPSSFWSYWRCLCCQGPDMNVQRTVRFDGHTEPKNKISNAVNNQKYNVLNFLLIVLFNQFKLFFNFFQLAINVSQLIPILKVGSLWLIQVSSSHIYLHLWWWCCSPSGRRPMMTSKDTGEINRPTLPSIGNSFIIQDNKGKCSHKNPVSTHQGWGYHVNSCKGKNTCRYGYPLDIWTQWIHFY